VSKRKWLPLFEEFVGDLRISSKEETSRDGRGTALVLWESQHRFLREVASGLDQGQKIFKVLKSPQLGVTTVSLAVDLFWVAMHPGLTMAIVTDTEGNREKNRTLLAQYVKSFPEGYFGDFNIIQNNRQMMRFSNGSRFDFKVAGTKDKGTAWAEGEGYAAAHITELANFGSADGLRSFEEAFAQNNPDSIYIYESPLALDTPIPTPTGWTTMGDIQTGDWVFGEDGKAVKVAGTSPVFLDRKCYRIEFSNGDSIVADSGHKWLVEEARHPTNPQWKEKVVTTAELNPVKHIIRLGEPLDLPDVDLPIDPYLVGAWLGDGATAEPRITASKDDLPEMVRLLEQRGHQIGTITRSKDRAPMFHVTGIRDKFIALGLRGNKHVPKQYLRASERQRRELLAGLMDTDGSIHKTNWQCCFASINMRLIDDVSELLSSLGIKHVVSVNSEDGKQRLFPGGNTSTCKKSWRILFSEHPDRQVFNLPRKRDIHQSRTTKFGWRKAKCVRIRSITEVPSVPVKCIAVDSPTHLFLAGRTMIPTHNTAKGHNIWYDTWMAGFKDPHKQRSFFVGWWANPNNAFKKSDPRFAEFGLEKPTREEQDLIDTVNTQHDYAVSAEQLAWYRYRQSSADTTADGTLEQNQPWTAGQAFIMTGQSFFNVRTLTKDTQSIIEAQQQEGGGGYGWVGYNYDFGLSFFDMEMVEATDDDDPNDIELRVWEPPKKDARYVIGCDPAYGRNEHKDRSAISVWRCYADKLVQVAEYASYLTEVDKVAWVLAHIAGCYTDCMVNLDIGGPGRMIMHEWKHLEQMIGSEAYADRAKKGGWEDALSNARWYLYNKPDSMGAGYVYNFEASFRTKQELMHGLRGSYITRELLVRSLPLLREMGNVVQDGSSIEAPESSNPEKKDDRVFAAGLAVRAWHNWRRSEMLAENLTYERVMAEETGAITQQARSLNGLVARYFAWQQALDEEEQDYDNRPQWKTDRGLA